MLFLIGDGLHPRTVRARPFSLWIRWQSNIQMDIVKGVKFETIVGILYLKTRSLYTILSIQKIGSIGESTQIGQNNPHFRVGRLLPGASSPPVIGQYTHSAP